ncbi:MAG: SsrA-binding protein SmpB [Bacteroidia bacterium]|nr:SsrA-binding protein SmpB [Bacteroidota bacterium]MBP6513103.1 SsrA-binding protein SmpB [Bacteroidia bacterium]MBP7245945.1 SsrA-binding protein SmpB [Bacteroidia bacterium]
MSKIAATVNIVNRKASFNYFISDSWEAGIVLTGTEIKAIREGKANLVDAYCVFKNTELWVKNLHISAYEKGGYTNHTPREDRKLLLHRYQLKRILAKLKEKGVTLIPLRLYIEERGFAKLELGLARGKKLYDKRDSLKDAEAKRELGRVMKKDF